MRRNDLLFLTALIVTVAAGESSDPSFALNVKESVPLKLAVGVYVKVPFALTVTAPLFGSVTFE